MLKKEARKLYREKRNTLTAVEKSKLDDLLLIQFQTLDLPLLTNVLSYWPVEENKEPDTHLVVDYLRFKFPELQVLYPRSDFTTNEMRAVAVNRDTRFVKNEFNIYEPEEEDIVLQEEIDMIIVPLLAVDRRGFRIGYGKGFYDKFLSRTKQDCIRAGLSYFDPLDSIDDCNEFDVPLNLCITPHKTYVF
jgi:5-formyltetrahydrofolate cyclo-ligase